MPPEMVTTMHTNKRIRLFTAIALSLTGIGVTADAGAADLLNTDRLESRIATTYELSPYLRTHQLGVVVNKEGEATISGMVNEDIDKELAGQIALGVDGIKKVKNNIEVKADYKSDGNRSTESFGNKVDDFTITTAVKSKLLWSKHTDGMEITVTTVAGVVSLEGKANTAQSRELASRIAMNTDGVRKVDNKMEVANGAAVSAVGSSGEASSAKAGDAIADTWITSKVKSTYMYSSNLDSSEISVSTSKGVVTLSGKLDTSIEKELAVELANNIRGVVSVNSDALSSATH